MIFVVDYDVIYDVNSSCLDPISFLFRHRTHKTGRAKGEKKNRQDNKLSSPALDRSISVVSALLIVPVI